MKNKTIHWGGGATIRDGRSRGLVTMMGKGWPCCRPGDNAIRIRLSGLMKFNEDEIPEVTCKRCRKILEKRIDNERRNAT